ncbi:DNA-formamidopyrimidine glycosylase [Dolosicoccus paucivorans]|uniref:Formamidopyrimidine-DNA glycosylase n=1 Tax=Dolosicoccus paucivorans TaxID=84521 RepID=A0A2N6SQ34_9LACT|nr:DNA-formamidopyrimidine glycosylase [Dolosicoccus paucivorans]PMB84527.1 DNA-formamidopyrimidine glycosylase [Dolosicoccus paucivorans]PMC59178.1 DNA-formamidopyrimidine glycosylase [Dolosicoccus paucivorans]
MPELPEVEAVRKGLNQLVQGKVIQQVTVDWPNIIDTTLPIDEWSQLLQNERIEKIERRGKYLIIYLTHWALISHLRMEGKYNFYPKGQVPSQKGKHVHVRFLMTDGSQLEYDDVRKFGRMTLIDPQGVGRYFEERKLGPEPTKEQFRLDDFASSLKKTKRAIKTVLLDQKSVAGLGNIYVDEVLFRSKIHPETKADLLTLNQVETLREQIIQVLQEATAKGGSTIRTYKNSLGELGQYQKELQIYGRTGALCIHCQTPIEKIKVGGRGTHYCPKCQPLKA